MKKYLIVFLFLFAITQLQAQEKNCNCSNELNWIIKTFEENDAGFQHVIDKKGIAAYKVHNQLFFKKVKAITSTNECNALLNEWTTFFRKGHLSIRINTQNNNGKSISNKEIKKQFSNSPTYVVNLKALNEKLKKEDKPSFEGIWKSGNYTVAIVKDNTSKNDKYIGAIVKADGIFWSKDQIKLVIEKNEDSYDVTYGMRDHSTVTIKDAKLLGNNFLKMDWIYWERLDSKYKSNSAIANYVELMESNDPMIKKISENTIVLRIPSFNYLNKKTIDSLLKANHKLITTTQNLIIDIRNNGGGSDSSYNEILPYLYTNPIRSAGVKFLSTPLNNTRMKDFMKDPNMSKNTKEWAKKSLVTLEKHIGEFVNLNKYPTNIYTSDKKYTYPKNVGVLINQRNGSTAEQFILAAKQSKKVKLFGVTTYGVLDISNMYFVNSPSGIFKLGYSLSKSFRIPHFTIDSKGLQPDFYINNYDTKEYEWIQFTEEILNSN